MRMKCANSTELIIVFCVVRSLSLKMNETKREPSIRPHEILSENIAKDSLSVLPVLDFVCTSMAECCPEIDKSMGLSIQCLKCNSTSKIEENPIIKCKSRDYEDALPDILERYIENMMANHKMCCTDVKKNYSLAQEQMFLILKFENPIPKLRLEKVYRMGGEDYKLLSFIKKKPSLGSKF